MLWTLLVFQNIYFVRRQFNKSSLISKAVYKFMYRIYNEYVFSVYFKLEINFDVSI